MNLNVASITESTFMQNPIGAAMVGSALDFRPDNNFKRPIFGQKSYTDFFTEILVGGVANEYVGKGLDYLGLSSYAGIKGMLTGGLKREGVVTIYFGATAITSTQLNTLNALISDVLKNISP
ncbi:hypothetical protein LX64_01850 [Chitinophaga skermanii]|uniref:Uncharacterized protein n=2 Tax=Chitinophaga skermanii TaxID=331697 RepID=A0A327QTI8_9BACT|nr:hypothetical protein LX64_01850 [Chitinophaga skermanii]